MPPWAEAGPLAQPPELLPDVLRPPRATGLGGVTGRFTRGRWEYTLRCLPQCPSWTGQVSGFTGHSLGAAAAGRAGMSYWAIDGTSGGVVIAAPELPHDFESA